MKKRTMIAWWDLRTLRLPFFLFLTLSVGCSRKPETPEIVVYCGVDEPYARECFAAFEKRTGLKVSPQYDIESSKSVGMAGKLEAEKERPRADVWWGGEGFLAVRLAKENVLQPYESPSAADIPPTYHGRENRWTGVGLRARVLAISTRNPPPFKVTSVKDLSDPRLKGKIAISRPTAGATGAHVATLYSVWGREKAADFFRQLHANGIAALGGNAEVADQTGLGNDYCVGLTDSDDVLNTQANGGKLDLVVPDQGPDQMGTLAMPTSVGLVAGAPHAEVAKKLVDFLLSKDNEQHLIDMHFSRWSVRGGSDAIKTIDLDYDKIADVYPLAQREATAILDGREP